MALLVTSCATQLHKGAAGDIAFEHNGRSGRMEAGYESATQAGSVRVEGADGSRRHDHPGA